MITYSKSSGVNNAAFGKLETPIKMVIEHESDLLSKKGGICDWLFNVEKSNRFGETIVGHNEFGIFMATSEGEEANQETVRQTFSNFIEHIQFTKEFVITAEMMEDANYGVAHEAKRRAENFTRAYYKTRHKLCQAVLANAVDTTVIYAGKEISIASPDNKPLFHSGHKAKSYTQSNFFYGDIFKSGTDGNRTYSTAVFEEALNKLAIKLRNMRDENGDPMGYTADTIILPGNCPMAEMITKKVCGTPGALGNGYNDINLQYGNWNIIVMPDWNAEDDRLMIMSSEANKNLGGNMFFNRIPLTVANWVDHHTGNYVWTGRCRFGIGFGSYKHILLAADGTTPPEFGSASPL